MAELTESQRDLLRLLVKTSKTASDRQRGPFIAVRTHDGESIIHPAWRDSANVHWSDLEILLQHGLALELKRSPNELVFDVTPEGEGQMDKLEVSLWEPGDTAYYHIEVELKKGRSSTQFDYEMDLSREETGRLATLYASGKIFFVHGRRLSAGDVLRFRVAATGEKAAFLEKLVDEEHRRQKLLDLAHPSEWHIIERGLNVTREFVMPQAAERAGQDTLPPDPRDVFVVHGRNLKARDAMFHFLSSIGLRPIEWSEALAATGKGSPYIGEVLEQAFSRAQAVVVLFTPDEEASLRPEFAEPEDRKQPMTPAPQARPNVLFEAGMAMGRFPNRTVLVELGILRPFSDVGGRHVVRLTNATEKRQELAQRLESAGCQVQLNGTFWHTAGDFESALATGTKRLTEGAADDTSTHWWWRPLF